MNTHTDPTAAALLRAILLCPADDAARLVLADWLDEHGEHERAEFIRVQCELARKRDSEPPPAPTRELAEFVRDLVRLENRERELLTDARRGEWSGIPCPVCDGTTVAEHTADGWSSLEQCDHCTGTDFAPVEFRRGFPERVRCRMGDVLRWSNSEAWTLTPWARGVLAAHPVTRWEIVDREPAGLGTGIAEWYSERADLPNETYRLPTVVFEQLKNANRTFASAYAQGGVPVSWCAVYDTEALARDALALAVGRVARRLAGLPDTGTSAGS